MQKNNILGNTKIIVCNKYAVKTEEERIEILTDLKKLVYQISKKNS